MKNHDHKITLLPFKTAISSPGEKKKTVKLSHSFQIIIEGPDGRPALVALQTTSENNGTNLSLLSESVSLLKRRNYLESFSKQIWRCGKEICKKLAHNDNMKRGTILSLSVHALNRCR